MAMALAAAELHVAGLLTLWLLVQALTEDELMTVLREPKNALCKQYKTMFKMDSAELRVTGGALRVIAREAVSRGTGARGLRSIMERLLRDAQYEVQPPCPGRKLLQVNHSITMLATHAPPSA